MHPFIDLGEIRIASYGLMMVLGFLTAAGTGMRRYRRDGGHPMDFLAAMLVTFLCALAGAFVLYVLVTYPPATILNWFRTGDFSDFGGGLVFYGGLLAGIPGFLLGCRFARADKGAALRAAVSVIPLGHALGRVGCFLGGCCYGVEWSGFPGVYFPVGSASAELAGSTRFPVQLLEAALLLGLFLLLSILHKKGTGGLRLLVTYGGTYSLIRFACEFFRGDAIRGCFGPFSTSQWISILIFLCAAAALLILRGRGKTRPAGE